MSTRVKIYDVQADADQARATNLQFLNLLGERAPSQAVIDAWPAVESFTELATTYHVVVDARLDVTQIPASRSDFSWLSFPTLSPYDFLPSEALNLFTRQVVNESKRSLDDSLTTYLIKVMTPGLVTANGVNGDPDAVLEVLKVMKHAIDAIKLGARHGAIDALDEILDLPEAARGSVAAALPFLSNAVLLPLRNELALETEAGPTFRDQRTIT